MLRRVEASTLLKDTAIVTEAGAQIDEAPHRRVLSMLSVKGVEVELVLPTRNADHVKEVVRGLVDAGFDAQTR